MLITHRPTRSAGDTRLRVRGCMARVDCVEWAGCRCWFWSHDHLQPHFHVASSGEWEIRVFFGDEPPRYDVEFEARKVPRRALRKFLAEVAERREQLLEEWNAKVQVDDE